MREILFRGKSVNDNAWVEGSLVVTTIEPVNDAPIKHYHIEDMTIGVFPNEYQSGLSETVDPITVGQFTGLNDKNGKKIFEGDILQFLAYGTVYTGKVEFLNGAFWVKCRFHDRIGAIVYEYKPEIIGNIYDNPELLEELK